MGESFKELHDCTECRYCLCSTYEIWEKNKKNMKEKLEMKRKEEEERNKEKDNRREDDLNKVMR